MHGFIVNGRTYTSWRYTRCRLSPCIRRAFSFCQFYLPLVSFSVLLSLYIYSCSFSSFPSSLFSSFHLSRFSYLVPSVKASSLPLTHSIFSLLYFLSCLLIYIFFYFFSFLFLSLHLPCDFSLSHSNSVSLSCPFLLF